MWLIDFQLHILFSNKQENVYWFFQSVRKKSISRLQTRRQKTTAFTAVLLETTREISSQNIYWTEQLFDQLGGTNNQCFSVIFVPTLGAVYLFFVPALSVIEVFYFWKEGQGSQDLSSLLIFWNRNASNWHKLCYVSIQVNCNVLICKVE